MASMRRATLLHPRKPEVFVMKRLVLIVLSLALAAPLLAADRVFELEAFATWVDPNSSGTFNAPSPNQPFNIDFNGDLGWGVGANIYLGKALSLQFTGSEVKPKVNLTGIAAVGGNDGKLRMVPLTAVAQWHFTGGTFDPYIGAGGAYFLFTDVKGTTGNLNIDKINFKHDVGLALNAGLNIGMTQGLALYIDGKYVPIKSSANAVFTNGGTTSTRVKINPVMFSGGLAFRF
jgi:outer membrane protein